MRTKIITIAEVEFTAFSLVRELMTGNEPIPEFGTRFPNVLESCLNTPFAQFSKKHLYRGLVGKSSILNALLGRERAVVTSIPGTTMDSIDTHIRVKDKDFVLIDTAGRMHTKTNLMSEMQKIVKVTNPDLKIFVAESIAGNDATEQAKIFHESINIDGAILSKADIDEKGGTIISISAITRKPIFYLGTGQNYSDLKLFNKQEFIESLGLE